MCDFFFSSSFRFPDQFAHETEARITPLINEKRKLFNDLLTTKGTQLLGLHFFILFRLWMHSHEH